MTEDRYESDASAVHGCAGGVGQAGTWNCRMNWHRADSRQRMSLQHSDRKSEVLHCVGRRRRESVCDTRLLGKPSDFSGAQDACRDWSTVFKGYAGAAIPRLQKLMDDAAKATEPTPNATVLDGRSGSVGTALLDDAHDLQGCSSHHHVPGRRPRRSRGLATTDGKVRGEDENSVRRATDVHPVLLVPR